MRNVSSLLRRHPRLRVRGLIALVAVAGLAIGLWSGDVQRARLLLAAGQPEQAWTEAIQAPRSTGRDRVLVRALARVLGAGSSGLATRMCAAVTLSCLAPEAEEAVSTLQRVAADADTPLPLVVACTRALGLLGRTEPRAAEAMLALLPQLAAGRDPSGALLGDLAVAVRGVGPGGAQGLADCLARLHVAARLAPDRESPFRLCLVLEGEAGPVDWEPRATGSPLGVMVNGLASRMSSESAAGLAPLARGLAEVMTDWEMPVELRRDCARALTRLGRRGVAALPELRGALASLRLERERMLGMQDHLEESLPDGAGLTEEQRGTGALLADLELLAACLPALGEAARGAAPELCSRLREAETVWVPALVTIYAAIESSHETALPVLRRLVAGGRPLEATPAALEILRHDPGDPEALSASLVQVAPARRWQASLGRVAGSSSSPAHAAPWLPGGLLADLMPLSARGSGDLVLPEYAPVDAWRIVGLSDDLLGHPDAAEIPLLTRLARRRLDQGPRLQALDRLVRVGSRSAEVADLAVERLHSARGSKEVAMLMAILATAEPDGSRASAWLERLAERADPAAVQTAALVCVYAGVAAPQAQALLSAAMGQGEDSRDEILSVLARLARRACAEGRGLGLGELRDVAVQAIDEALGPAREVGAGSADAVNSRDDLFGSGAWAAARLLAVVEPTHPRLQLFLATVTRLPVVDELPRFFCDSAVPEEWFPDRSRQLIDDLHDLGARPEWSVALFEHLRRGGTAGWSALTEPWSVAAALRIAEGR